MLSEEGREVKRELEKLNQTKRQLRNLQDELKSWEQLDGAVKSSSLEDHVSGGQTVPYAERRLLKIEELKKQIYQTIDEVRLAEDKFLQDITKLDGISQNLLFERYMSGKPLNKIIREFSLSDRQVRRIYYFSKDVLSVHKEECYNKAGGEK